MLFKSDQDKKDKYNEYLTLHPGSPSLAQIEKQPNGLNAWATDFKRNELQVTFRHKKAMIKD